MLNHTDTPNSRVPLSSISCVALRCVRHKERLSVRLVISFKTLPFLPEHGYACTIPPQGNTAKELYYLEKGLFIYSIKKQYGVV